MIKFNITHTDGKARCGTLSLPHGDVQTPAFMPVGTQGTVKTIAQNELEELDYSLILSNTYHLYLRPGLDLLTKAGGLHKFMSWDRNILTDSGGYQVMSLSSIRKMSEEGVEFRSHLDGSKHLLTPELALEAQGVFGSDIAMALDECPPYPCDKEDTNIATQRTHRWAKRTIEAKKPDQNVYGIIQGGTYDDLRQESLETLTAMDFEGFAIGGVSVGEPVDIMYRITEAYASQLPANKPRYLMGVGRPEDILFAIGQGIDQFDCVLPTRVGRHMAVYTSEGRKNLRSAKYAEFFGPVDSLCQCAVCKRYSAAYIRHLFRAKEPLAAKLATYHNLYFYKELVNNARQAIIEQRYQQYVNEFMARLTANDEC